MDLIVAVCRVLANHTRLRILQTVYSKPGMIVKEVASCAHTPEFATSRHLNTLAGYHLVEMTPAGREVTCALPSATATSHPFLSELQTLLKRSLSVPDPNRTPAQVCDWVGAEGRAWEQVYVALVAHFTAYTHLRRLLILRHLEQHGPCSVGALMSAVGMSPDASRRQLDKLRRRGLLRPSVDQPGTWELGHAEGPPLQRALLAAVLRAVTTLTTDG